jgi:L-lysine exporter family protein LysE/ArgO
MGILLIGALLVIVSYFVVTWLNPQALIDGSLLLGSYSTTIAANMAKYFILGFTSASILWFLSIATLVLVLRQKINQKVIKGINVVCSALLIFFGAKLGYSFIQML